MRILSDNFDFSIKYRIRKKRWFNKIKSDKLTAMCRTLLLFGLDKLKQSEAWATLVSTRSYNQKH